MIKITGVNIATRQVRQQWFSVCIFLPGPGLPGLIRLVGQAGIENQRQPNRPQSSPAGSFLRYGQVCNLEKK